LKERVKQKLIYSKYKRNFEQYNRGKVQDAKNWKVTSNLCVKSVKN
jgi:hypothetical protein